MGSGHFADDITGQRFGRLLVTKRSVNISKNPKELAAFWHCTCDCGNERIIRGNSLRTGRTKSCGCLNRFLAAKRRTTHGLRHTPEYGPWMSAINRCCNPNNKNYAHYGGRGITICQNWRDSFEAFRNDMGPRPDGTSLDRINNDGNYEKGNCRWATHEEQSQNRRKFGVLDRFTTQELIHELNRRNQFVGLMYMS